MPSGDMVWYRSSGTIFLRALLSRRRIFGELEAGISGSTGASDASFLGGVRAGYAHFITNSVAVEGTLGYAFSKANISNGSSVNGLGIGLGFQIYLSDARNR